MKSGKGWLLAYTLTILGALAVTHLGSRAVTTVSEHIPIPRQNTIIIDAGHGGIDGGAASCTGKLESSYNLEISLRLQDLLHLLGYKTKMVRTIDESVYTEGKTIGERKASDLKYRVRLVNETDGGILVSIHQNQYPDRRYFGAQVFYADTAGSKELAGRLQKALAFYLSPSTNRREKKCSGIYLMEHIKRPGILLECGFLSNREEEARLSDPNYQKQLCSVIAFALGEFLG